MLAMLYERVRNQEVAIVTPLKSMSFMQSAQSMMTPNVEGLETLSIGLRSKNRIKG